MTDLSTLVIIRDVTGEAPDATLDHRRAVAERNLTRILDAAERVLARRGQLTISAVAEEAGVSRMTVYAHFADRRRLLEGIVERAVRRWIAVTEQVEPDRGEAGAALRRLIDLGWEQISANSHIAAAASAELGPEATRRSHESGQKMLLELIDRGRREGAFRTDVPPEWLVSAFFALMHAGRDDVAAKRLEPGSVLDALRTTVPELFAARGGRRRKPAR